MYQTFTVASSTVEERRFSVASEAEIIPGFSPRGTAPKRGEKALNRTRLIWEVSINGRNKAARVFVILGSVALVASAALHCFAGYSKVASPALAMSNLDPGLQAETRLRKTLVLFCGLAVLLEAGVGASMMGFFIGNEMIGAAALLLVCGGLLFEKSGAQT
jgi:hypothetical protein